jgi:ligand-binding sensor domain-containing protein/two-component sensor histidine kinase
MNWNHRIIVPAFSRGAALLCLCFWSAGSIGASTNAPLAYSARIWQTEDGLPQNSVAAITQTHDGYLWVGTHDGLARFDGVRFSVVDDAAAPELKRASITALCAANDGSLWIGLETNGLTRLKDGKFSHFSETTGLPNNQTHCLIEAKDSSLWMGSEGGLTRFRDGKWAHFTDKSGLGDNSVRALSEDMQGNLRIATRRGLSTLGRDGLISTLNVGTGMVANVLKAVCVDEQGTIWLGANEGLTRLEPNQRPVSGIRQGLPHPVVTVIQCDHKGDLWIGTYGGVARVVDGKVVSQPLGEAAFGDLVYAIYEDRENNLWIGGRDGLYRLNPARFTTYTMRQGLTYNNVMSVCEDRTGAIWIGTWGGGLNRLVGDTITAYGVTNGLTGNSVLALHEGRDGSLWIGMEYLGGLNRFKPGELRNSFKKENGPIDQIKVIQEDRQGTIWVGTSAGLKVAGKPLSYSTANGLAGNLVMAIHEDGAGNLWVGTDGGLSEFAQGKWINYTTQEGLSANAVDAIYEDREHTLWLGTKGGGLNRLDAGRFKVYTTRDGLFSDEVYEIVEDDGGYFWMSCRSGIFRVKKRDLDAFDAGAIKKIPCTSFSKADGLLSVQCNGVAKPAGWKGRDGRIWFPTIRGVVAVETRIETNEKLPPVVIEEILADKKKVTWPEGGWMRAKLSERDSGRSIQISPGRGELEIHYTALSFKTPEKNRFKYRLDGVDSDWVDAEGRREVHYNNLAPRSYRFQVIACNNDGVWNDAGAAIALTLEPHFWQTVWFKFSIPALFGLMFFAWYRFRLRRLRAIERLRIQIAADLHDDVGARLTKVAMVTEFLDRETEPGHRAKTHVENIARTTREIIQAMDEIVWTINPKNDTLDNLANYIFQYAQDYFQDTTVRCRVDMPARLPDVPISTEERHNLFMAVKEALNNVLKHSGASEVRIALIADEQRLTIIVSDNGSGFLTSEHETSGNGLRNMTERLDRIGGKLTLESEAGKGTRIKMEVNGG